MEKKPRADRWDSGTRDTRSRSNPSDSASGWDHSTKSTFSEPSRLGEQERRRARPRRRGLALLAGFGVAAVAGVVLVLLTRGRRRDLGGAQASGR